MKTNATDGQTAGATKSSPKPLNETARIAALERYGILDMPSDAVLDSLTQAAASLCEVPTALISLIDSSRLWFKSSVGTHVKEVNRDFSFCNHAILTPEQLLEVEDAHLDARFKNSPLVTGEPYIRFYAGKALMTPDGFALGTLCVIDDKPRQLSVSQRQGLDQLSNAVVGLFRERFESRVSAIDQIVEQSAQDAVMIIDADQVDYPISYVNQAFEMMTGYSREEVLGSNWRFLQGEDTDPASVARVLDAIAAQKPCALTLKNYRKDGTSFWNDLVLSPVRDPTGQTLSFVGILRNVSDRVLAEDQTLRLTQTREQREQARSSRNRLAQIVEDSSNEIYVTDAQSLRILNANRAARKNLGYSLEESRQLMPWDFVVGLSKENFHDMVAPLKSGELDSQIFETAHRRKDGSTYPVSVHLQYMTSQYPPVFTAIVQDISERERQEESVRLRERAIEAVDVGVTIIDATQENNPLVYVNQALCEMTGYSATELIGEGAGILQKNNPRQPQHLQVMDAQARGESVQVLFESTRKDGSHFSNDLSLSPVFSTDGKLTHYIGINRDVTARLEAEERSQRSRKIEAIGQLAGGIAHDFNNLLSVITGNLEFVSADITNPEHRGYLDKADSAAQMSARLTRRLLSFARQGQLAPTVLNVNVQVASVMELLRSTIGEHITLSSTLATDLWNVLADSSEIENTVVNLVINARDAMSQGGTIRIETKNVRLADSDTDEASGILPGSYVQLSVSDTGIGMDDQVKARVFEPFFTTKEFNTGLGLASIHGFARQSGGDVQIHSDVDHGSTIKVYLPAHFEKVVDTTEQEPVTEQIRDTVSRILVVEDNDMVRELTVARLDSLGFHTQQVSDGSSAIQRLQQDATIDLVLTDIVMEGGMSGFDVAYWVQAHQPRCKVLLTSGFNNEQMSHMSDADSERHRILQKPYSLVELQQRINEALSLSTTEP